MKKIIVLVHEKYEELELWYPVLRLREENYIVDITGEQAGKTYIGKWGYPATAVKGFQDIDPTEYDAIVVPGGYAPDKLRRFDEVLDLIRYFDKHNKPIAQICHAASVLISAGILKNRRITSYCSIKDDVINASAEWINQNVIVDRNLISAQTPKDLPQFTKELINQLKTK